MCSLPCWNPSGSTHPRLPDPASAQPPREVSMSSIGKELRMRRIIEPVSNTSVMFAFSHGTSVPEVMSGIEDPATSFRKVRDGGANCAFLTPGLLQSLSPIIAQSPDVAIVAKITATATRGEKAHQERLIASVEHCATLGVDGVVALLPFAPENEAAIIT